MLVNRLAYMNSSPQRHDIIVFKSPNDPEVDLIKRVIAIAGDTIEVNRGRVFINGDLQEEDYVIASDAGMLAQREVPEGNVFVMGDNRGDSQDSRYWQPPWLPVENIIGKAYVIYWPPTRISGLG